MPGEHENPAIIMCESNETVESGGDGQLRRRRVVSEGDHSSSPSPLEQEYVWLDKAENEVEAQRITNNYMFGFKKWKSHVTARPLEVRSEKVKELYTEVDPTAAVDLQTLRPGNVIYVIMFGWWLSLIYCILALLMFCTIIARKYGYFCLTLAKYFIWPFGKLLQRKILEGALAESEGEEIHEESASISIQAVTRYQSPNIWKSPATYIWLILGCPLLLLAHAVVILVTWLLVIFIPVSKVNMKAIRSVLLMPPDILAITDMRQESGQSRSNTVLFIKQAINRYFYKYTVDGMNVIAVNMLIFVILALLAGYLDREHKYLSPYLQLSMALLAVIPLAYYIGMGITSISAQSNFAVGAVLNATFGSVVELALYIFSLSRGNKCYVELVKSALVGSLLATMLLIPGLCMVVGGLKHSQQRFNSQSAGVSSTLLFISVAGVFAPTIFSKAYGTLECRKCVNSSTWLKLNTSENLTFGLQCSDCSYSIFGLNKDESLYNEHIRPLVYTCAIILPLAYIVGLVFSHRTHRAQIYGAYKAVSHGSHGASVAHWGRIKSTVILVASTVLMSLCAELITDNIQPILKHSAVSVFFLGVTLLALVPDIPEIVNGVQFALQNNIFLSIEVGSCIATQVCMLQIPILVLVDIIHPMMFYMVFSDIHLYSVVFALLVMNYVFQDGKCNYFQGSALCLIYFALISMYFFSPNPKGIDC